MPVPNYSFVLSAQLLAGVNVSIGDVLIPNADGTAFVIATTANRGARGSEGVALSAWGSSVVGSVQMQQAGVIDATISGLGAGNRELVRVSAAGRLERIASYTAGDDVVGYAEVDGRVHLHFGIPWGLMGAGGDSLPDGWTDEGNGRMHVRNVEMGTGAALLTFNAAAHTITRDSGAFTNDGFQIGDLIVVDGSLSNDGVYTITNITGGSIITVAEALVNEGPIGGTNVYLYTQAYATYGPLGGAFPDEGFLRFDATRSAKLITASYLGGTYDILQVAGATTTIGDSFPIDANVIVRAGSDGIIQLDGTTVLLNWTLGYPSDDFIGSSVVSNSNFYLVPPSSGSGGVGAGRGIFVLGRVIAAPTGTLSNACAIYLNNPTSNGVSIKFPSGNILGLPDFNGVLPTSGGAAPAGSNGDLQTKNGAAFSSITPGTGVATWLATPSSANLAAAVTGETGSGALVFGTSPTIATPSLTGTVDMASGSAIAFTGATAPATSGLLRTPYAATQTIWGARASDTNTYALLSFIAADNWQLGHSSAFNADITGSTTTIVGTSAVAFWGGGVLALRSVGTNINAALPIAGYASGSAPFRMKRAALAMTNGSNTAAAALYESPFIDLTTASGTPTELVLPNTADSAFNIKNGTGFAINIRKAAGSGGVSLANGATRWVLHNGTDYEFRTS